MDHMIEAHVQQLADSGLVTHMIRNPSAIDPLFAISQVHDFTQVVFSAAFQDGIVVLGCPDGLPDALKKFAEPIASTPPFKSLTKDLSLRAGSQADPTTMPDADIMARFDGLEAALKGVLDQVHGAHTTGLDGTEQREVGQAGNAILEKLDAIAGHIATTPAALSTLQSSQDNIFARIGDPNVLIAAIDWLENIAMNSADHSGIHQLVSGVETIQQILNVSKNPNAHDGLKQEIQGIANAIKNTQERGFFAIEDLKSDLKVVKDQVTGFDREELHEIHTSLQRLEHSLGAPRATNSEDITSRIIALQTGQTALLANQWNPEQLTHIIAQIESVSMRPDPVLDLTAQRQSFARFAEATSVIVARLEGLADALSTSLTKVEETEKTTQQLDVRNPTDNLQALQSQIKDMRAAITDIENVQKQTSENTQIVLQNILDRPSPVIDLTMQRQSFAQFSHVMGAVVSRFDAIASRIDTSRSNEHAAASVDDIRESDNACETPCQKATNTQSDVELLADLALVDVATDQKFVNDFSHESLSRDVIMTAVAEIIALQIRDSRHRVGANE